MGFDERNESWDGSRRRFVQPNSRGTPRFWEVLVSWDQVTTMWGQVGGKAQSATEMFGPLNEGKANALSGPMNALSRSKEKCRLKFREGYAEVDPITEQPMDAAAGVRGLGDFDELPANLAFYKPEGEMSAKVRALAEAGSAVYTRKRNGLAFVAAVRDGSAKLYSRRMLRHHDDEDGANVWEDRFPHIALALSRIVPEHSILLGELVMDRGGEDDFRHVQSVTKALTAQALRNQESGGWLSFYVWDVALWTGRDVVSTQTVGERHKLFPSLFGGDGRQAFGPILPLDCRQFASPDEATKWAVDHKWEGFVVVDPDGVYGDKAYNLKGKPDRPGHACCKLKPELEIDDVALCDLAKGYGEASTKGRYTRADGKPGIKSVALYQFNSRGEAVYLCNCASGMTEAMKRDMADPSMWPQVWEVAFAGRRYVSAGDATNALDFPRFVRVRDDKLPEECVDAGL